MFGSILLAIVTIAIFLYAKWCAAALLRLKLHEQHAMAFYNDMKPLLDDKDTPPWVLDFIGFLNSQITSPTASIAAIAALRAAKKIIRSSELDSKTSDEKLVFFEKRPELGRAFARAVMHSLFAMSYLNPFFGGTLRRTLGETNVEKSPEASRFFVAKFEKSSHHHSYCSGHTANGIG